ncbi:hypothetical protein ACFVYR_04520 [Streptomyces sp. NPDC058284]|uniref:hypothetical protein n=1 Tax=unclassified Streptomyces TaxID=2593676 RepID=UPI00366A3210
MRELLGAAAGFPGVVFSAAFLVVIVFWLLVLFGGFDADGFDEDADFAALGLGGVPVTVPVSLIVVIGWFTSVTGAVLLARSEVRGVARLVADGGVFLLSLLIAWWLARAAVRPLAKLFADEPGPSRRESGHRAMCAGPGASGASGASGPG